MNTNELTQEQQFSIAAFNSQVNHMSREQAIEMLKMVNEAYVVQKATYQQLLKEAWKLEPDKR